MCTAIWYDMNSMNTVVSLFHTFHSTQTQIKMVSFGAYYRASFTNLFHIHQTKITIRIRTQIRYTRNFKSVQLCIAIQIYIFILIVLVGRAYVYIIPLYVNIEHFAENLSIFLSTFSIPVDLQIWLTLFERWYYCFGRQFIRKTTNIFFFLCV